MIPEIKNMPYPEGLRINLIQVFRIVNSIDDIDLKKYFTKNQYNSTTRQLLKI